MSIQIQIKEIFPEGIIDGPNQYCDEKYTDRHLKAFPPENAFMLNNKGKDIIEINEKEPHKNIRRIFELPREKYTKYENDQINSFFKFIEENNVKNKKDESKQLILPEYFKISMILRFLQATCFNYNKSLEYLSNHISWRKSFFPFKFKSHISEILNSGFIYMYGRDKRFRPVIILDPKIYIKNEKKYSFTEWLQAIIYFMEYLIKWLVISGQLENWIIITDLRDVSLFSLPSDIKEFLKVMQSNYRARLYINYIIGMNFILRGIWAIVKTWLDPETNKKIQILGSTEFDPLFKQINPSQIEKKFNGLADNLTNDFFPPHRPLNDNLLLKDDPPYSELLYSEEEYEELLKNSTVTTPSPYYLEKKKKEREEFERQKELLTQIENERLIEEQRKKDEAIRNYIKKLENENNSKSNSINKEISSNFDKKYLKVHKFKIKIVSSICDSPFAK